MQVVFQHYIAVQHEFAVLPEEVPAIKDDLDRLRAGKDGEPTHDRAGQEVGIFGLAEAVAAARHGGRYSTKWGFAGGGAWTGGGSAEDGGWTRNRSFADGVPKQSLGTRLRRWKAFPNGSSGMRKRLVPELRFGNEERRL